MVRNDFPSVFWPEMGATATFAEVRGRYDGPASAVIVFGWTGRGFLLAEVRGRGWCTPSGRIKPGEAARAAALRETREETGADLKEARMMGIYSLTAETGDVTFAPAFLGRVEGSDGGHLPDEIAAVREFGLDEIPAIYYRWDGLLEAVFRLAEARARRIFSP